MPDAGFETVRVEQAADVQIARRMFRRLGTDVGLNVTDVALGETAVSEIAHNMLAHACGGEIHFSVVHDDDRIGVRVVACDSGPAIEDLERAMSEGYSTGSGLGLGLPGAKRLMDDFDIDSVQGRGTTVAMIKWAR